MSAYLSGLLLGLAIIPPIGAESLFVLNQGTQAGFPRALVGVSTVCVCETFLIVLGAVGAPALLVALGYREVLITSAIAFLVVAGLLTLRARPQHSGAMLFPHVGVRVAQAVGVSLLNPHAILDTISIIGGAIAAQAPEERIPFVAGTVSASWLWFFALCIGASTIRPLLTSRVRLWIQRGSGVLMLAFAGILLAGLT